MDIDTFLERLKSSEAGQKYLKIVSSGKVGDTKYEQGFERHHILPRALGGTDSKDNIVKLKVIDHIIAHVFLAKAVPCYDTINSVMIICGRQSRVLTADETQLVQEAKEWANVRELSRKFRRPQSEETKRKFIEGSKITRLRKYGDLMKGAHDPKAVQKRLENVAKKYSGDSAGQLHTDSSKLSRKVSMVSRYGGCTKHMQDPLIVEKARQTRIKHAEQSHQIMETEEYQKWFRCSGEKSMFRGVPKFLREINKTREEFLDNIKYKKL